MSSSVRPVINDDDGPEEGEIEDDEDDDIILLDACGSSPPRSSTTSASLDIYASPSPARKDCYERDIRHFEHRRARTTRRTSGGSKSPHSVGSSTHNKSKYSRTGLTQGKENRHIHRRKSPIHVHHHRKGSNDRTLTDFKDVSPVRRASSCSSIDSEEIPTERSTHYRSTRSSKFYRTKRKSSSSPDSAYIPSKRRAHHSEKCPLMKVLHSVAKETRLIAMESSESHAESSSLRQRLLNMGAMPAVQEEATPSSSENKNKSAVDIQGPSSENSPNKGESCKAVQTESTQTEDIPNGAEVINKPDPEIVILTDSEETCQNKPRETIDDTVTPNSTCTRDPSELISNAEQPEPAKTDKSLSMAISECDDDVEDNDEDYIGRLRLLALQSKKHEPTPIEDADVLQLRLDALKTAFMKKFKIRKKITIKINCKPSKEDPLSPLDEIPIPFSPPDAVMTPVDMELAETDDEAASVHSISHYSPSDPTHDCYSPSDPIPSHYSPSDPIPSHYSPSDPIPSHYSPSDPIPEYYSPSNLYPECYSPSDPTGSPILEPSLQDLLPPPPPPDLDLFFPDQNFDNSFHSVSVGNAWKPSNFDFEPSSDIAAPPPLPPYFRELLSEDTEYLENSFVAVKESIPNVEEEVSTANAEEEESTANVEQEESTANVEQEESTANVEPEESTANVEQEESTANVEEEENTAPCNEPLEVILHPLAIPNDPPVFDVSGVATVKNSMDIALEDSLDEEPIPVFISLKSKNLPSCNTTCKANVSEPKETKTIIETKSQKSISLEEEERVLRKRLLLNMANKREKLFKLNHEKGPSSVGGKMKELMPKIVPSKSTKVESIRRIEFNGKVTKALSTESSTVNLRSSPAVPNAPTERRFIINLADDSDSCEDYSEAEALGHKCAKNKERWLLHLKELEVNPPKMISGNKISAVGGKVPSGNVMQVKETSKEKNGKKPFAENLADLESKVERFLKGVRSSHEAISKTSRGSSSVSSNATPVAVKHLPASQQEEYRRLKQQIAKLEKQRQISIELQKRGSHSVSKGTQISSSTNTEQVIKTLSQVVPSPNNLSKILPDTPKRDLKSLNGVSLAAHSSKQMGKGPTAASLKLLKVASLQSSVKTVDSKVPREVPVVKSTFALANVSNLNVISLLNAKKLASQCPQPKLLKANNAQENINQNGLSCLEATLVMERSHVLSELSALAKVLSQVEKSLEAQSNTSNEVSSLIEKLCAATGRWNAQNHAVTGLVERVAQRQKELSLRHRRYVTTSKSCAQLGGQLIGKHYRVPSDKSDAMLLQLKQVHEKTGNLAKRKTAEQARRNALEKRAEDCLVKLVSNSSTKVSGFNATNSKTAQAAVLPSVAKPLVTEKPKPIEAPTRQPPNNFIEVVGVQQKQLISTSAGAVIPSPAHEQIDNMAVKCSQVNSSMIYRAISYRLALNKVRSAKVVLNMAKKKHLNRKKLKVKSKRCCPNTQLTDQDCLQDPSDMDISTDSEEAEKNKDSSVNSNEVDMSVSPNRSPSPSGIPKDLKNNHQDGESCIMLASSEPSHKGLSSCSGNTQSMDDTGDYFTSDVLGLSSLGRDFAANQTKSQKSQVQMKTRNCASPASSISVLKDYVSPLGGFHVSSNSSSGSAKGKTYEGDLYAILCPYDLNGKCQDSDCCFQHQHE